MKMLERLRQYGYDISTSALVSLTPMMIIRTSPVPVAQAVARARRSGAWPICGSGVGASVAANKVRRALALCSRPLFRPPGGGHYDMNVLCLGGRVTFGHALGRS